MALYDATVNGKPKWTVLLADAVTCVDSADVNGDGKAEVIAGSPSGWLTVFALDGKELWATPMPHEIRAVSATGGNILVACADARVYQVTCDGRIAGQCHLAGTPLGHFSGSGKTTFIGDAGGRVTALPSE